MSILENRTKENLLPIIKTNVNTFDAVEDGLENYNSIKTRIYSDSYASYQVNDFRRTKYKLHKVNHSIWFGYGQLHSNNIVELWSQIKRVFNNFSGLSKANVSNQYPSDDRKKDISIVGFAMLYLADR